MRKKKEQLIKILTQCWNCKHWEKYNDMCKLKHIEKKYDEDARTCRTFKPNPRA